MIRVENILHMEKADDLKRFLVDREWPNGVVRAIPHKEKGGRARAALAQIRWSPELAPSPALWKWFHHDPDKIERFRSRYFRELEAKQKHWLAIARASEKEEIVLLYHGKSAHHTPAQFLKQFLEARLEAHRVPAPAHVKHVGMPGRAVAPPVEKAISRRRALPLKKEISIVPELKLRQVPAQNRRVLR